MWRTRDLIIVLIVSLTLLAALEWAARKYLLQQIPQQHGPRAEAILNPQHSKDKLVYPFVDPLLGWGSNKKSVANQSVVVLKSSYPNPKKILILGGSTSDLYYDDRSWPYFLNQIFEESKQAVELHVGAVGGHNSHQELLKIVRDARLVDYDLILSYTGVNEAVDRYNEYPFTPFHTQYFLYRALPPSKIFFGLSRLLQKQTNSLDLTFGPKDTLSLEQRFLTNIKSAKAISEVYGAHYAVILQPYLTSGQRKLSNKEKELAQMPHIQDLITRNRPFYQTLLKDSKKLDYLYDGTEFLDELKEAYHDDCHTHEQGNKIIARKISRIIKNHRLLK